MRFVNVRTKLALGIWIPCAVRKAFVYVLREKNLLKAGRMTKFKLSAIVGIDDSFEWHRNRQILLEQLKSKISMKKSRLHEKLKTYSVNNIHMVIITIGLMWFINYTLKKFQLLASCLFFAWYIRSEKKVVPSTRKLRKNSILIVFWKYFEEKWLNCMN